MLLSHRIASRAELHAAAKQVWMAMFYLDRWPPELQQEADDLQPVLFRYGTIHMTVDGMSGPELEELRGQLVQFLEQAEMQAASSSPE